MYYSPIEQLTGCPYDILYGLHPLMFIKFVLLAFSGDHIDANLVRVCINKLIDHMKKLKMTNIL